MTSALSSADRSPGIFRVDVLGVGVSTVTPDMAIDTLAGWIERRERRYVCVTGVHGVMESQRDPGLLEIHNDSGLTVPDGMPMVWACRRVGADWVSRVYGPDLMRSVCARGATVGWRMFLYGATPEILERLARTLRQSYPGLQIVGSISPPFRPLTDSERDEVVAEINAAEPDIVWVGLSTPKQERWMSENRAALSAPVLAGVGAAFDLVSGTKRHAPPWLQGVGLEWLYRLVQEPRRLWRRYARNNPMFIFSVIRRPPALRLR
jgi:N-acetylglucosaminyldiphosphoundecaprenol N-acetyl-beta-D-mannosaminyltransferase